MHSTIFPHLSNSQIAGDKNTNHLQKHCTFYETISLLNYSQIKAEPNNFTRHHTLFMAPCKNTILYKSPHFQFIWEWVGVGGWRWNILHIVYIWNSLWGGAGRPLHWPLLSRFLLTLSLFSTLCQYQVNTLQYNCQPHSYTVT